MNKQIIDTHRSRFSCKEFDAERKISDEDFDTLLEVGRLSPSSFGFEPWKFLVLQNPELREKIRPFCWGAQKQLPTASHFVILLARRGTELPFDSIYLRDIMVNLQKWPQEMLQARKERVKSFQEQDFDLTTDRLLFEWACRQTYIVLANMMTTATTLGIDSCAIEGFNREQVETVLREHHAFDPTVFGVSCMVAFGYRASGPKRPKTRRPQDVVVEWIK